MLVHVPSICRKLTVGQCVSQVSCVALWPACTSPSRHMWHAALAVHHETTHTDFVHCLGSLHKHKQIHAGSMTPCGVQVLSMSELVKGAVAEAEAYDKQVRVGSTDAPATVQLGRAAQASMQVKPICLPFWHDLVVRLAPCPLLPSHELATAVKQLHRKQGHAVWTPGHLSKRLNSCV